MDPLLAMIVLWPVPWVPQGWLACDGSVLSIAQNTALFSLIGTTYGGNGSSTFALPDFRGKVALGVGTNPQTNTNYLLGTTAGTETVTLTATQMPSHLHAFSNSVTVSISASGAQAVESVPTAAYNTLGAPYDATNGSPIAGYNNAAPNIPLNTGSASTISGNTVATGSSGAHSNMQPYLSMNYILATQGIYPSRP